MAILFIILALLAVVIPLEAWALMVMAGVVRSEWLVMIPPLGYGAAIMIILALFLFIVPGFIIGGLKVRRWM